MSDQQEINRLSDFIKNLGDIKLPSPEIPIINTVQEVITTVSFNQLINPEKHISQGNKFAPSHLEIAGGHHSNFDFLNVDPLAKQGLNIPCQDIPKVIQEGSVKVVFLFNPYFEKNIDDIGKLMEHLFDYCLAKEGVGLVGGNLSNRYFKKIWNQKWQNFDSLELTWHNPSHGKQQLKQLLDRIHPRLYDHLDAGEFYKTSFYTGEKSEADAKTIVNHLKLLSRQLLIYLMVMNCY